MMIIIMKFRTAASGPISANQKGGVRKGGNKMRHYYVDYENVAHYGLEGLESLERGDKISIFFSENARMIDMTKISNMQTHGIEVDYQKITQTAHNALDFALVTELAMYSKDHPEEEYYIISQDKGFKMAARVLRQHHQESFVLRQAASIQDALDEEYTGAANARMKELLPDDIVDQYERQLERAIRKSSSKDQLFRSMVETFGQDMGQKFYTIIKKDYKGIRQLLYA